MQLSGVELDTVFGNGTQQENNRNNNNGLWMWGEGGCCVEALLPFGNQIQFSKCFETAHQKTTTATTVVMCDS